MIKAVKVADRTIGDDYPCFLISEIGINYEKNISLSYKLIDMSKRSGFDAVKFQVFRAERMYTKKAGKYTLEGKEIDIYKEMSRLSMPYDWLPKLAKYAQKSGILFFASPFDEESADELEKIGIPLYKIASYELTNLPLLQHIAKKGKPMLVSTGGANIIQIKEAVETIKSAGNGQIILMQCVAKYPAPLSASNLSVIPVLKRRFNLPVGFSDNGSGFSEEDVAHEKAWILAPVGSVIVGANVLEKHTTLDRNLKGNDQRYSIEEDEQRIMIKEIKQVETEISKGQKLKVANFLLGRGVKVPQSCESYIRNFAYKTLFTAVKMKKGELITRSNTKIVRPGKASRGLEPKYYKLLINTYRINKDMDEDMPIKGEDVDKLKL